MELWQLISWKKNSISSTLFTFVLLQKHFKNSSWFWMKNEGKKDAKKSLVARIILFTVNEGIIFFFFLNPCVNSLLLTYIQSVFLFFYLLIFATYYLNIHHWCPPSINSTSIFFLYTLNTELRSMKKRSFYFVFLSDLPYLWVFEMKFGFRQDLFIVLRLRFLCDCFELFRGIESRWILWIKIEILIWKLWLLERKILFWDF